MNAKSAATLPLTPSAAAGNSISPGWSSARTPDEITADAGYLTAPVPDALFGDLEHEGSSAAGPVSDGPGHYDVAGAHPL